MAFAYSEYKKMASRTLKVMRGVKFYKKKVLIGNQ